MYSFNSKTNSSLGAPFKKFSGHFADYVQANWLTRGAAKSRAEKSLDELLEAIDAQVQMAYHTGRDEMRADNERLRNKIADLTAELALRAAKPAEADHDN